MLAQSLDANVESGAIEWRKVQLRYSRTGTSPATEDYAVASLDLINFTSGDIDPTWTSGDYTSLKTRLDTFHTAIAGQMASGHTYIGYRAYRMQFRALTDPKPFAISGPPEAISTSSIPMTGTGNMVRQAAMSVTERTAWPRHWGRFYLPPPSGGAIGTTGRITDTAVDLIASAAGTMYTNLASDGFTAVVPVTQVNKSPARALLTVDMLQVDDVPDVVRRRRPRQTLRRTIAGT